MTPFGTVNVNNAARIINPAYVVGDSGEEENGESDEDPKEVAELEDGDRDIEAEDGQDEGQLDDHDQQSGQNLGEDEQQNDSSLINADDMGDDGADHMDIDGPDIGTAAQQQSNHPRSASLMPRHTGEDEPAQPSTAIL